MKCRRCKTEMPMGWPAHYCEACLKVLNDYKAPFDFTDSRAALEEECDRLEREHFRRHGRDLTQPIY
jgi:hypothetical protein